MRTLGSWTHTSEDKAINKETEGGGEFGPASAEQSRFDTLPGVDQQKNPILRLSGGGFNHLSVIDVQQGGGERDVSSLNGPLLPQHDPLVYFLQ